VFEGLGRKKTEGKEAEPETLLPFRRYLLKRVFGAQVEL
jgi:hypothetical protein